MKIMKLHQELQRENSEEERGFIDIKQLYLQREAKEKEKKAKLKEEKRLAAELAIEQAKSLG